MKWQVDINEESYKMLQAALVLTGEKEEDVVCRLISQYTRKVFEAVTGIAEEKKEQTSSSANSESEQKQKFVAWFRGLMRNGKPYNPVTISGYTGRIENACTDPTFANIPVKNLFAITDLAEFLEIQKRIKACDGYAEFDAKSHNGFTAALRKYEEFLRFQIDGAKPTYFAPTSQTNPARDGIHRWTMEEDMICCRRFLECYVVKAMDIDAGRFLQKLKDEVPNVSEGSLRMKIQNVKFLAERAGIKNTSRLKWLSQYSSQCERAFYRVLKELNIQP